MSISLTKEDLEMLSDVEVLDIYDNARQRVSFYNAAEGENWRKEASARIAAQRWMEEVEEEVVNRKLTPHEGNYLL